MAACAGLGEEGVTKVFPDLEGPGKTPGAQRSRVTLASGRVVSSPGAVHSSGGFSPRDARCPPLLGCCSVHKLMG